jgi:hypothetical protein
VSSPPAAAAAASSGPSPGMFGAAVAADPALQVSRGAARRTGVGPGAIVSTLAKNGTDSKNWRKERLFGTVKAAAKAPGDDDDDLSGTILMYDNTSSIPQIEPAVHAQRSYGSPAVDLRPADGILPGIGVGDAFITISGGR